MDVVAALSAAGVHPSAQRVAVASFVLAARDHPSADEVWQKVRRTFPILSRATVYNTLHLFVEKGLLRELNLAEGKVVFDPKLEPHHHFVDEETGAIRDVPWRDAAVGAIRPPEGYEVTDFQVVMRGRRKPRSVHSK